MSCSSIYSQGIADIWTEVSRFNDMTSDNGRQLQLRAQQSKAWMWSEMEEALVADLKADESVKTMLTGLEAAVVAGHLPATVAAQQIIDAYKKN